MKKKVDIKLLAKCIAIPILVGAVAGCISGGGMRVFVSVNQPPLSPPAWAFPCVWTILYTLMGISSYWIMTSGAKEDQIYKAMSLYWYQLAVNFLWPTFFFNFRWYLFSFFWLVLLWVLVLAMILRGWRIDKRAAYINIPYLVWLTFAGYLNLGIWWLN